MATTFTDWKDAANAQFDKALALGLVLLLFGFMVVPKLETQKVNQQSGVLSTVDLPPEEREKIKPPEEITKPVVDIQISTEFGQSASDPNMVNQLLEQMSGDIFSVNTNSNSNSGNNENEKPFDFVPYDDPPVPITQSMPDYPPSMVKLGIEGTVVLEVDVYADGTVGNIRVKESLVKGPGGFDEAAVNAVKKWKFQPGKSGGKAVDTSVIIPLEFTLQRN